MAWRARRPTPGTALVVADPSVDPAVYSRGVRAGRVVLVGPESVAPTARKHTWEFVRQPAQLETLNLELRSIGPVDHLVIATKGRARRQARLLGALSPHVVRGGLVQLHLTPAVRDTLLPLLERIRERASSSTASNMPKWRRELGLGIDQPTPTAYGLAVRKSLQHFVLLRDAEVAQVLRARPGSPRLSVLARRGAGQLSAHHQVSSYPSTAPVAGLGADIDYPELTLRRYEGALTLGSAALVTTDSVVLPESFKWQGERVHQPRIKLVESHFGRIRGPRADPRHLPGAYYFFDYAHPGHYGHLMTEALAKLWGWEEAKAVDPGLRLLMRTHHRDAARGRPRADLAVLRAYGIHEDDLVWVDGAVTVDVLVGATPTWHNKSPFYAHPETRHVWQRLRSGFGVAEPAQESPRLVFVTRHEGNRLCRNVGAVEELFREFGFSIVHPGGLSPGEQASVFSNARVIAGFGGTGMFNMLYASGLEDVVVLNHEAYEARNEHMMAALLGADVHYFWSAPDVARPVGYYEAFQSGWEFDLATNEGPLRELLERLT
ncbi:glycosyltransferase family 61 protein [Nocardioides sp. LHG3406-4]|uniref:glycosyltransferase family 61 protein n=1 Tax=Nocardioides sp. LHG3406-4 TaxID=2804575 RepID=UPI003CF05D78